MRQSVHDAYRFSVDLLEVLLESLSSSFLVRAGWLDVEGASPRAEPCLRLSLPRLLTGITK